MSLNLDKSNWETVRFGEVVKHLNETVRDASVAGIDRVIGLEHLDPGLVEIARWGDDPSSTTFTKRVRPGQTLFGKRRAYQRKAAYAEFDAITSGDILIFEAVHGRLSPELLPFLVHSEPFFATALETSAGSLSPRTNWRDLAKFEFDLPPLPEQRRLSDLLWATEHHRRSLFGAVATMPSLRSATVRATNPVEAVRVDSVAEIRNGQTFPKRFQGQSEGDYPFFKVSDLDRPGNERWLVTAENWISQDTVRELRARLVQQGDVITVRVGAALRAERRRIARSTCLVDDNQLVVHPVGVEPNYLWAQLAEVPLAASRNDGVVPSINQAIVGSVTIPLPSREEQARLGDQYMATFDAVDALRGELEGARALTASLLKEVFG